MTEALVRQARIRGLETGWLESAAPGDDAPILLFLHGFPDSPEIWDLQRGYFQRNYLVVCPFMRGIAPSEGTPDLARYGQDATTLDLLQILREVDPEGRRRIFVVGHDLGVVHACHLAPHLTNRLAGMVLFNGLSLVQMWRRGRDPRQHLRSWYIYLLQVPGLPEWFAARFPGTVRSIVARLGGPAGDVPRATPSLTRPVNQYRQFVRELPRSIARGQTRVDCPVLVLWGRRDPFLLSPSLDEWDVLGSKVTVRLLDAGHWVYRERPDEVNRLMGEFLDDA